IHAECYRLARADPAMTEEQIYRSVVAPHDGQVSMNQISPKVFEAVRLKTGLILMEGNWSDVLEPFTHYLPIKKDWSNIEDVLTAVMDDKKLAVMTERAHRDLIASGRYSYAQF